MLPTSIRRSAGVFRCTSTYLTLLLFASTFVNVLQINTIRRLQHEGAATARGLRIGDVVPPLHARTPAGTDVVIDYAAAKATVLYVFSPSCGWCNQNAEAWSKLVRGLDHRYPTIGLSLDKKGLSDFLAKHAVTFPVYTDIPKDLLRAYKLGDTPHTLVISREGRVMASWSGAYKAPLQHTIEGYFGVHL
jgi:peroxiredoxin